MNMNRRHFLGATATAGADISYSLSRMAPILGAGLVPSVAHAAPEKPALLGGKHVRNGAFPSWPVVA